MQRLALHWWGRHICFKWQLMVDMVKSHYLMGGDHADSTGIIEFLVSVGEPLVGIAAVVNCHDWKKE